MKRHYLLKLIAILAIYLLGIASAAGIYVLKRTFKIPILTKPPTVHSIRTDSVADLDWDGLTGRYSFLKNVERIDTVLYFPDGEQRIDETIIIPAGYTVMVRPNSRFLLGPGVSIVSFSPVIADGTEGPIRFESAGPTSPFGVIAVIDADSPSELRNVEVRHGSDAYLDGQYISGAMSFIHSEVHIYDSVFSENRAEDALNIRYATTTIERTQFHDNAHDGLDLDTLHATLTGNSFERNGNDGIDLSSSTVVFTDNRVARGKRCMEIGEGSRVTWENNTFTDCRVKFEIDSASHIKVIGLEL